MPSNGLHQLGVLFYCCIEFIRVKNKNLKVWSIICVSDISWIYALAAMKHTFLK